MFDAGNTGWRCGGGAKKKQDDGLVPNRKDVGIGSLRRRLQKDSREQGSGIFIIGITVTVSKPFTALISVVSSHAERGREK